MEGLALTGASVDREQGLLSTIVLEMGGSSDLCALLKPGEPVILMGPTGTPTETPAQETVLLVGGGLGNAVLFSIGQELREQGLAGALFRRLQEDHRPLQGGRDREGGRYGGVVLRRGARLHAGPRAGPRLRRQYRRGDGGLRARRAGRALTIPLHAVDRLIVIGSDGMMRAVAQARHGVLRPVPEARPSGHRQHQLADAVHDEGDLRPVPADAHGTR